MKKRIISICNIIVLIESAILIAGFFSNNETVSLALNGSDVTLLYVDEYDELGASAKVCNKDYCEDISDQVEIESNVTQNKVGSYEVVYKVAYNKKIKEVRREVNIVDNTSPTITLDGASEVKLCPNANYQEDGVVANDDYDGNITDSIKYIRDNSYVLYTVKDSSDNETSMKRILIREDLSEPTISLNGNSVLYLNVGDKYVEYGVTAYDDCDGDLSSKVEINSNLNMYVAGKYLISYTVRDSQNNAASVTRTVNVRNNINLTTNQTLQEYISNLEKYITAQNYKVSIGYYNLITGYTYRYNSNEIYYGASLAKTMDALYLYENGNITPDIQEKIRLAITYSDNDAHHDLVNYIGIDNLRKFGKKVGCSYYLTTGSNKDHFGNTVVDDQLAIWKYLNRNLNDPVIRSYFNNTYYNNLLFPNAPTILHKYGYYGNVYHDTGIVYSRSPYIVVILTKHGNGDYQSVVRDLSEKIYYLNKVEGWR